MLETSPCGRSSYLNEVQVRCGKGKSALLILKKQQQGDVPEKSIVKHLLYKVKALHAQVTFVMLFS